MASSTPDSIILEADSATSTATTTPADEALVPDETVAEENGQVLGETTEVEDDEYIAEVSEEQIIATPMDVPVPPPPQLSIREFKKRVVIDKHAFHSCEAEVFRVDVSGKASARARIVLQRDTDASYEVEIGGLPQGIDMRFSKNNGYQYAQGANEKYIDLEINNQTGSQEGDFTVPIMYTQKGDTDSSVICQINIVNQ